MKFKGDVDIDVADRQKVLEVIDYIPSSIREGNTVRKHASGIHPTEIPYDPIHCMSSLDYNEAEKRGYLKIDLLNVHVYEQIKNEEHLIEMMKEPNWQLLRRESIVKQTIHIANHFVSLLQMPEPVNSIPRLAMFLAIIRPSKKHLIGLPWHEVAKTVWDKDTDGYVFKMSHSIGYAQLVVVHLNLLEASLTSSEQV